MPGLEPRSGHAKFIADKSELGKGFSDYFIFLYTTLIIIHHLGLVQWAKSWPM
jgi:hypothetical protein